MEHRGACVGDNVYGDGARMMVLNLTIEQMNHSRMNLTVADTKETVVMIEGAADFLT